MSKGSELLTTMAVTQTGQQLFETLLRSHANGERPVSEGEEILGISPEELAADLGWRAGEKASELAVGGGVCGRVTYGALAPHL